jgi:hypothetical protein
MTWQRPASCLSASIKPSAVPSTAWRPTWATTAVQPPPTTASFGGTADPISFRARLTEPVAGTVLDLARLLQAAARHAG